MRVPRGARDDGAQLMDGCDWAGRPIGLVRAGTKGRRELMSNWSGGLG